MSHVVKVLEATQSWDSKALDLRIIAVIDSESPHELEYMYTFVPGDPNGFGPWMDAWRAENPDFPILPYDPNSRAPMDLTPVQFRMMVARKSRGGTRALAEKVQQRPDSVEQDELQIHLEYATLFEWEHKLTQELMELAGLSKADWLEAQSPEA